MRGSKIKISLVRVSIGKQEKIVFMWIGTFDTENTNIKMIRINCVCFKRGLLKNWISSLLEYLIKTCLNLYEVRKYLIYKKKDNNR